MSDNRKYYYLKLKENYFDDDSIVLLESMQDGVLYSNILLKLYLKSLKHGGRLQLDEDMADLQASFPAVWEQYIEKLSEYMASTGKRYQSHAATIRRWAGEDAKKAAPPSRNRDYSVKEDETVGLRLPQKSGR